MFQSEAISNAVSAGRCRGGMFSRTRRAPASLPASSRRPKSSRAARETPNDELFLDDSRRNALATANLKQNGTNVGVNQTTFDACVDGNSKASRVQADIASGIALGVNSTPTLFVGGQKLSGPTKEQLFAAINQALTCAGATPP